MLSQYLLAYLTCFNLYLQAATWVDEGMVKSIRGVTFSTRVSPQIGNRIVYAARGIFNRLIPDVHIFTDHRSGPSGGKYAWISACLICHLFESCQLGLACQLRALLWQVPWLWCIFSCRDHYGVFDLCRLCSLLLTG